MPCRSPSKDGFGFDILQTLSPSVDGVFRLLMSQLELRAHEYAGTIEHVFLLTLGA